MCSLQPVYGSSGGTDWHAVFFLSAGISIHIKESRLVPFLLGDCRSQSPLPDVNGNKDGETVRWFRAKEPKWVLWFQRNPALQGICKVSLPVFFQTVTSKAFCQWRRVKDKQAGLMGNFALIMMTYKCYCKTSDSTVIVRPSLKYLTL